MSFADHAHCLNTVCAGGALDVPSGEGTGPVLAAARVDAGGAFGLLHNGCGMNGIDHLLVLPRAASRQRNASASEIVFSERGDRFSACVEPEFLGVFVGLENPAQSPRFR